MDNLIQKIRRTIQDNNLFKPGDPVLVGVSGGPDSVFLLYILKQLSRDYDLKLHIAHVNHQLRRKESGKDYNFVRVLAQRWNIPFYSTGFNTKRIAKARKLSIEDAARRLRYDFFINVARGKNINKIAVAHTKDDQSETILMRLLRGTGLTGLCGMQFETSIQAKMIIRPLLKVEKSEILQFLKKHKIKNRSDSSNFKTVYFRNKIRLKVIPFLENYSPHIKDHLIKLAESAKEIEEFLAHQINGYYLRLVKETRDGQIIIKKTSLSALYPALRRALIRRVIAQVKGDLKRIDFKHIEAIDNFLIKKEKISKINIIDLPDKIKVNFLGGKVIFKNTSGLSLSKPESIFKELQLGKELRLRQLGVKLKASLTEKRIDLKKHSPLREFFDAGKIKFPLIVRNRRPGDSFWPLGVKGHKKIKKFFIDEKVSVCNRDKIPLVISGSEVIWIVGMRISDCFKVTDKTKRILRIEARKINANYQTC